MSGGHLLDEITAATAVLRGLEVSDLSAGELAEGCLASTMLVDAALALSAALLAEFQQRGAWSEDGAGSAAAWVAARTRQRHADLAGRARLGAALRELPDVEDALDRGEITIDHARRVADCARKDAKAAQRDLPVLLDHARALSADHFRVVAREWRGAAEDAADGDVPVDEPARREFVHLSQTFDGWWRLDGEFNPDNGQLVAALLDEYVDKAMRAQRDGDPSLERLPASGLRAGALVDLVAQHQRRGRKKSVADRYRVAIVIRPDEFPMAACDSDLYRLVMTAEGEVLDIGRTTRLWTPPIRRSIRNRDMGCVFPGCDRPPSWCDVHHCWDWNDGGSTCRDNGALLCRRHHTFIHAKKWRVVIRRPGGKPQVLRADGTRFTITPYRP